MSADRPDEYLGHAALVVRHSINARHRLTHGKRLCISHLAWMLGDSTALGSLFPREDQKTTLMRWRQVNLERFREPWRFHPRLTSVPVSLLHDVLALVTLNRPPALAKLVDGAAVDVIGPAGDHAVGQDDTRTLDAESPRLAAFVKWLPRPSDRVAPGVLYLSTRMSQELRSSNDSVLPSLVVRVNTGRSESVWPRNWSAMVEVSPIRQRLGGSIGVLAVIELLASGVRSLNLSGFDLYLGQQPYGSARADLERELKRSPILTDSPTDRRRRKLWDLGLVRELEWWRILCDDPRVTPDPRLAQVISQPDAAFLEQVRERQLTSRQPIQP